jgi:hypothetical protein
LPKGYLSTREELVQLKVKEKEKTVKRVYARYKPIGADVMRWLYCRQNPANLNFGPETADEVRAKFVIKLWNCYGFFANYASLDGFDPAAPQVPEKDRADIDRWLLSDLQLLIKKAREEFEAFNVMGVCLAAEEFVDAKLSNWYIRRNRDRFWSKNTELDAAGSRDKLAAYQTLHTVLLDLCRLCAPIVPFLTEVMWKNLRGGAGAESVHLTDYPTPDESLIDSELSRGHGGRVTDRLARRGSPERREAKGSPTARGTPGSTPLGCRPPGGRTISEPHHGRVERQAGDAPRPSNRANAPNVDGGISRPPHLRQARTATLKEAEAALAKLGAAAVETIMRQSLGLTIEDVLLFLT